MTAPDLAVLVIDLHDRARQLEQEKGFGAITLSWQLRLLADDVDAYANGRRVVEPSPSLLLRHAAMRTIVAADRLYRQAARDLANYETNPGSDLARVKKAASEQMQDDARDKVVQTLRGWAAQLERERAR